MDPIRESYPSPKNIPKIYFIKNPWTPPTKGFEPVSQGCIGPQNGQF